MWKFRKVFFSLLSLHPFVSAEDPGLEAIGDEDAGRETASAELGWSLFSSREDEGYTINFKNVSIQEYLRFIGKISGIDFIYNDAELNFPVTIVSEEPMTLKNILSALVQTLRINGLNLLEQENSLIITRSPAVAQVSPLDIKGKGIKGKTPALITRFFRIKNANLTSAASVIKPMISQAALLEAVPESRLLIITDTVSNIEQIAELLEGLDSVESPLEIETYRARHIPPAMLIDLTKQIVAPFSEGSPLIFVPQSDANIIFIVSTPALVERVIEIMEDLDTASKSVTAAQLTRDQVFLYKIENKSHEELIKALNQVGKEVKESGAQSIRLIDALENVKWVRSSNALLFITDTDTQTKLLGILKTLDTVSGSRNFYIYRIESAGEEQIERSLGELAKSLKKNSSDLDLANAIQSMRYIKESNSIIFTGSDEALKKLATLLPTFDTALAQFSPTNHYWIYTPQYLSGKELERSLEDIEENLDSAGLADHALLNAISSMKWVPSTNTLLFTGDPTSLTHIESIIKLIDIPTGSPSKIFIYQPTTVSYEQIEEALDELADKLDTKNVADRNLASAIDHMTWIGESQSFLFKADPATIEKIQSFLKDLDTSSKDEAIAQTYFLYNLKYARGQDVLAHLESIAKNLPTKDLSQKAIVSVIDEISLLQQTNSLLLTGTQRAVDDVKTLIAQFDQPNASPSSLEKTSFFFYKPVHLAASQLKTALEQTAQDLKAAGLVDPVLLDSIETMRIVDATNTLVFTGSTESLQKTKEILSFVDMPGAEAAGVGQVAGQTFFLYRAHNLPLDQLLNLLTNVAQEINHETPNRDLIKSVKGAKIVKETNSFSSPAPLLFCKKSPSSSPSSTMSENSQEAQAILSFINPSL